VIAQHRLSLLDRLRGWHWEERQGTLVRVRNWCGCEVA